MSDFPQLLLVEDDASLASMVSDFLSDEGYAVDIEPNGRAAVQRLSGDGYDAAIVDIGLPGMDGFEVCRTVRPHFPGPILVLTARGDERDEVVALEVGADDFMTKPVRPHALAARLKGHLRRADTATMDPASDQDADAITAGTVVVRPRRREATVGGEPVSLTTAEFDLLEYLARRAGQTVTRQELSTELLGLPYDGLDRSIDLRVSRLRRKLGDDGGDPNVVKSVRGVGYLLVP